MTIPSPKTKYLDHTGAVSLIIPIRPIMVRINPA